MMNAIVKHVVEIAGGILIGSLASDAVNSAVKLAKETVVKVKNKGA